MARLVRIASISFWPVPIRQLGLSPQDDPNGEKAHVFFLEETKKYFDSLRGYGLDLVVTTEKIESYGQNLETAESVAEPGPYLQMYMDFAKAERCHVAGACKIREGERIYKSIAYISPEGAVLGCYHKTFNVLPKVENGITSGRGAIVVDTAIGRLGGAICFDLNFEELRREYAALSPDIITFGSAYHGGLVQGIWAYECRAYFVSSLMGHESGIIDPFGRPVSLSGDYVSTPMAQVNLDYVLVHLDGNKPKFADIIRKYHEEVTIDIPDHIGSAMIVSNVDDRSAIDIVNEFELELLDDYFARNREANSICRA